MTQPAEPQEKAARSIPGTVSRAIDRTSARVPLRPPFMTVALLAVVGGAGGLATRPPTVVAELRDDPTRLAPLELPAFESEPVAPPVVAEAPMIASGAPRVRASSAIGSVQFGQATYVARMLEGRPTASGEPLDHSELVAAHRDHPFGTWLKVTDEASGKSVVVRVNDRGPFEVPGRETAVIDLSRAAASQIDLLRRGRARVRIEVIPPPQASDGPRSGPSSPRVP